MSQTLDEEPRDPLEKGLSEWRLPVEGLEEPL